jgi:hypothetical protein
LTIAAPAYHRHIASRKSQKQLMGGANLSSPHHASISGECPD